MVMSKGTSQKERMPAHLDPGSFSLDGRSVQDLFREAIQFAEVLAYHESSPVKVDGNWAPFLQDGAAFIRQRAGEETGECPPQLGLLIAFFKLYKYPQQQLNELTSSHIRFFYQNILTQRKKQSKPDKVFVFFELAKNIRQYRLAKDIALLAGKDKQGDEIHYTTDRETFLGHASISRFKSVLNQKTGDSTIHAYPAVNSSDGFGKPLEEGEGWHPFGYRGLEKASAAIGFGIQSPVLILNEGVRTIRLELSLTGEPAAKVPKLKASAFEVLLTGPEDWITRDVSEVKAGKNQLTFTCRLQESDPAVMAFDKKLHGYELNNQELPMLIIRLKPGYSYKLYETLRSFQCTRITVRSDVENVRMLLARNDFGELDTSRAFHPFGFRPVRGDNVYLGSREIFFKILSGVSLKFNWKGLPEKFKNYYEGYLGRTNSLVNSNEDFKVRAAIRRQSGWQDVENPDVRTGEYALFSDRIKLDLEPDKGSRQRISSQKAMKDEEGMIRLTLSSPNHGFGHSIYPLVYAEAIRSQLEKQTAPIPNEPYTPIIESVELGYSAEGEALRFFHVNPFGIEQVEAPEKPLLPVEFHYAGSLYLGIENLNPPQQLPIFFDIEEDVHKEKPNLELFCLGSGGWSRLTENQVLSDTTLGLRQTGILLLNLPGDLRSDHPAMPAGFHWIRISIPDRPEYFGRIMNVRTNVASCTLSLEEEADDVEINSLEPNSIQKFSGKIPEIKSVEQPYSSFGGRPAEKEDDYFTRVSEKLRHKMRGISAWDMERLILDEFPEIYKVWCLPHRTASGRISPGNVHIIVIPYLKTDQKSRILKPRISESKLIEIQGFIKNASSSGIKIQVTNPEYEEIKIEASVSFSSQVDAGYYVGQLQSELQGFLSPWAFSEKSEIRLGDKLYRSSIIEFIDSRDYVNFIASIRVLKQGVRVDEEDLSPEDHTLVVSSESHEIETVEPSGVVCQTNQGVGQMIVDINFEVQ